MVANGAVEKEFKGITAALSNDNHPFAPELLHAYVHNRFFSPTERDFDCLGQRPTTLREDLAMSEPPQPKPHRLIHFTPLRYPGGKGKLTAYIKALMKENRLLDGEYVEPYAGGAAIALELLFHEYVSRIHINDVSRPVYSFWKSVLQSHRGVEQAHPRHAH